MGSSQVVETPSEVFQGYDTFEGKVRGSALTGKTITDPGTAAQSNSLICTSSSEVLDALSVSGSVSASYGAFSATATASYVHSLHLTETSVVALVRAWRLVDVTRFDVPDLTVAAPTAENVGDFFQEHGDSYVSSISRGLQYWSTFVHHAATRQEQQDTVAALYASGAFGGASGSMEVATAVSRLTTSSSSTWAHDQGAIGLPDGVELPSPDEAVAFGNALGKLSTDQAAVLAFTAEGYENAPNVNDALFLPLTESRERIEDPSASPSETVLGRKDLLLARAGQIQEIANLYAAYGVTDPRLGEVSHMIGADVAALEKTLHDVRTNPFAQWEIPPTPSLDVGRPERNVTPQPTRAVGGTGGDQFPAPTLEEVVGERCCPVALVPRQDGSHLSRLELRYARPDGQATTGWGSYAGTWGTTLQLSAHDVVNGVDVIWDGGGVRGLTVRTSGGQQTTVGTANGYAVESHGFNGTTRLVGFHGRAHRWVDQLGLMLCTFEPVTWNHDH